MNDAEAREIVKAAAKIARDMTPMLRPALGRPMGSKVARRPIRFASPRQLALVLGEGDQE